MAIFTRVLFSLLFCTFTLSVAGQGGAPDAIEDSSASIRDALVRVEELRNSGEYKEGLTLALETLETAHQLKQPAMIAEAHYQTAILHNFLGEFDESRAHLELGLAQARAQGLKMIEADLLVAQGIVEWKLGNLNLATRHLENALVIREEEEDSLGQANIANNLGIIQFSLKNYNQAIYHYKKGIEWLQSENSDRLRASLYSNYAESLINIGEYETAEEYLMKSLEIELDSNEPHSVAYTYLNLGELRLSQNRFEEAIHLFEEALNMQLSIQAAWPAAVTRVALARAHLMNNDSDQALEVLAPGYASVKELNALSLIRDYAEIYAEIYDSREEFGTAEFYRNMKEWMTQRIQEPLLLTETDSLDRRIDPAIQYYDVNSEKLVFIWVRRATIIILTMTILFLVIDRFRLRKDRPKPDQQS